MKSMVFIILLLPSLCFARGSIQNEDVKTLAELQSAVLSTTGNISLGSACISSPASTAGLAVGVFVYDGTVPANINSGVTVAGLPGSCPAGQIQMSATAAGNGTGDTLNFGGQMSQLINDTKVYVTANGTNTQLSTAIINGAFGGGGGGGALRWVEAANAPVSSFDSANNEVYLYSSGANQALYALVKVPHQYGGVQIKLYLTFYSADASGSALIQSIATLIRPATDLFSSVTNQRTSTNSAVTLSGGTVNIPQQVVLDLTDSTGKINGVTVAPDNYINVKLTRGTDTATSDLSVQVYGAEVTTH